jgi:ferredoxin-thioredoxin reductase catalytic subunit
MGPPPNSLNHSADSTGRASSSTQLENSHAEDSNLIVTSSMPDSDDIEEPGNVHCQLICHSEGQAQARVEKNTQVGYRGHPAVSYTPYQTPELRKNATCTPRSRYST